MSLALVSAARPANRKAAGDWPSWRGADRTARSTETGLLTSWPAEGPALLWTGRGLGDGFSTPSVAGKLIFVMGNRDGKEHVMALDRTANGSLVWSTPLGPVRHNGSGYPGPRSTPTVDGNRVYALGLNGDLACLDVNDGSKIWKRDLVADFGGNIPGWGYSESVLVDGPLVVCTPGGEKSTMLALNKKDGQQVWASPIGDPAGYSSIVVAELAGVKQYIQFTMAGVISADASDGKLLWRYNRPASGTANIATPIVSGNTVFATAGYGMGSGLVRVARKDGGLEATELYFTNQMKNRTGGAVLVDGYIYGSDENGLLMCIEQKSGNVQWHTRDLGTCSIVYADGLLFARSEGDTIALVKADPKQFELLARFSQPERSSATAYPHPVIADGKMYIRDQDVLLCYDVRGAGGR